MTDPQQRILLECAWEALEDSGYAPEKLTGSVGVYAGSRISEYLLFNMAPPDLAGMHEDSPVSGLQRLIGNDKDYLATRISFKLNLTGPSLTVQTACSTSLVAVHLACESLLSGECELALAGGVSVRVPQKAGYLYTDGMIFSPDGHTRAFDSKAGGTHFSSGAGMVILKRLEEAIADGDSVYAVIRGSAVNNDGSAGKAGYTAPSLEGQAGVIAQAMSVAGVTPDSIRYIETHGTGTALGDAIEIAALTQLFRSHTQARNFCALGSVKTNIGHSVQAAGVAGLIKTALMLKHRCLVPSLHFETANPQLNLAESPFYVNTERSRWPEDGHPLRAGVSSFGVGGTNAHVVLEEPPEREPASDSTELPAHMLCLSARSDAALKTLAGRYDEYLATSSADSVADICFTANVGRTHFSRRLAAVAGSAVEIRQKLAAFVQGEETPGLFHTPSEVAAGGNRIAFLFTGQDSQYIGMGRQLYLTHPGFREALDRCSEILRSHLKLSLLDVLYPENRDPGAGIVDGRPMLDMTAYTQPAIFALEYALARLWQSWGVEPEFVLGHSVGEYVAACVAGVFSLEDGLRLIAERGRLMQELPPSVPMVQFLGGSIEQVATMLLQKRFGRPSPPADHGSSNPGNGFDREQRCRSEVPASGALTRNDVEPEEGEL